LRKYTERLGYAPLGRLLLRLSLKDIGEVLFIVLLYPLLYKKVKALAIANAFFI
jgi:hypothetical protein